MLTFNDLLRKAGIRPEEVQLARHGDTRAKKTPFDLWMSRVDGQFDFYQRLQRPTGTNTFRPSSVIASFVVTPRGETLFVGLYRVDGFAPLPPGSRCPIAGDSVDLTHHVLFNVTADSRLAEYSGRVVIEWGDGARTWVQRADNQDKAILEIRRVFQEPAFPGFRNFRRLVNDIPGLPLNWQEVLRSARGVYVLTCQRTGNLYIGAAHSEGGFLDRFLAYAADGHGGNKLLKKNLRDNGDPVYQASILEVFQPSASVPEILEAESAWKEKLGSRAFGLNAN